MFLRIGRPAWLWLAVVFLGGFLMPAGAANSDREQLLQGVSRIAAPGLPGPLCLYGENAFTVVAGGIGKETQAAVVAAAPLGRGRVVAFGHPGYLSAEALAVADTGPLLRNTARWLAGEKAPRIIAYRQPALADFFRRQGMTADNLDALTAAALQDANVLCLHTADLSAADLRLAEEFARAGGGLLAADLGWGWQQLHPGQDLQRDHPGNHLLASAGIAWAAGTLQRTSAEGFSAVGVDFELLNAARALDAVEAARDKEKALAGKALSQAAGTLTLAARSLPPEDTLLRPRLRALETFPAGAALPSEATPLTVAQPLARLALTLQLQTQQAIPAGQIQAHPAAASFPGSVPADAPRVKRTVTVDTHVPGWHSTGLYAAPGEAIAVRLPERAASWGLSVRIGSHSDLLWDLDAWKRCPDICREEPVRGPETRIANAFGGLIYLVAPERCPAEALQVEIAGAVEAPRYVLGQTSIIEWREKIRRLPAPWAELETGKVILTVPAAEIRALEDPQSLLEFWDRVLDCCADLAGLPHERLRPERYVADVQISAGYLHSGYPIMSHLDAAPVMVDLATLRGNKCDLVWGLYHEMGHNHQSADWTFDGAGEVTVNLFTLYVLDQLSGLPPRLLRSFGPEPRAAQIRQYLDGGARFEQWKAEPFLALLPYIQLQEAFGWDAYRRVFAAYRDLPAAERPANDDAKRDQWLCRFSRVVGRNLGPFFQAWGIPTSAAARATLADLPVWMPADFPQKKESNTK